MVGQQAKHVEVILESPLTIYLFQSIPRVSEKSAEWFVEEKYMPRVGFMSDPARIYDIYVHIYICIYQWYIYI